MGKTRKLEMGCGSNFRCKFKEKGNGPLSRWADFKWSYPNGLYLELPFKVYAQFPTRAQFLFPRLI
jgi:hypothetical protein